MPSPAERFIDLAVRPLQADAEQEIAGRNLLQAMWTDGPDATVENAAARLEASDRRTGLLRHWQAGLLILTGIALALLAVAGIIYWAKAFPLIKAVAAMGEAGDITDTEASADQQYLGRGLNAKEQLILLGDRSRDSEAERWKALWESEPENPMYYIDYAAACISKEDRLPPDFLDTGARIDPGNGWYPLIAAAVLSFEGAKDRPKTDAEKKAKLPLRHTVKDEAKIRQARELFGQTARMPYIDSHQYELFSLRAGLLPKRSDALNGIPATAHMAGLRSAALPLRPLGSMIELECARLTAAGDRAGLEALIADWHSFVAIYIPTRDPSLVEMLTKIALLRNCYRELQMAADALGLEAEGQKANEIANRLDQYRASNRPEIEREDWRPRAAILTAISLPIIERQPLTPITIRDEDLRPGRLAEHEFVAKALAAGAVPFFLFYALLVALYRFRGGSLRRAISERLVSLLGPVDWAWVLGAGVALPLLAHHVISRAPWLGAREWSVQHSKFLSPVASFGLMLSLMTILPVVIARWRLGKRASFIGIRWNHAWLATGICALLAVVLPFAAQAMLPQNLTPPLRISYLILSQLSQLWLLVVALRGLFSKDQHLLKRITLSRVLLPAYALAVLLTTLSVPPAYALERYWAKRERLMEVSADAPAMSRYEYEVTQAMHGELIEIIRALD